MRNFLFALLGGCFLFAACQNTPKQADISPAAKRQIEGGIDTLTGLPIMQENPWKDNPCTLLPNAAFQQLFGIDPATDANVQSKPGGGFCIWSWMKPNWKELENNNDKPGAKYQEFKNAMALNVVSFGQEKHALAQMAGQKAANTALLPVPNLGNEAHWNAAVNTLTARKGAFQFALTLDCFESPDENLAKAKSVMEILLQNAGTGK